MFKKLMATIVAAAIIASPLANAAESTPVTRSVVEVVVGSAPSATQLPSTGRTYRRNCSRCAR